MEDTRAVQQSWKSFESDEVFTDKTLIEYYKLRLLEIKQKQKLLGQFTEDGKYVLSASIKKALVSLKKQIRFKGDDTLECLVTLKNIELSFTVQFWKTADKAVANLYFNESFSSDKPLKSFIAQYVASYDDTFFIRVKKVFNLFEDISELSYEQNDEIEKEYENMEQERKERELLLEIQSQYFILAMFESLQSSGERGQKILHRLKTLYDQEKEKPGNDLLYTKLREAFDKMVMETGGFNSLRDEIKEFDNNIKFYSKQIIGFDEANAKLKKYAETVNKDQKKSAGATSSKPKSSGAKYKPPKTVGPYKYTTAKAKKPDKPKAKADIMLGFKPKANAAAASSQKPAPANVHPQVEQRQPHQPQGVSAQRATQPSPTMTRPAGSLTHERTASVSVPEGRANGSELNRGLMSAADMAASSEERPNGSELNRGLMSAADMAASSEGQANGSELNRGLMSAADMAASSEGRANGSELNRGLMSAAEIAERDVFLGWQRLTSESTMSNSPSIGKPQKKQEAEYGR